METVLKHENKLKRAYFFTYNGKKKKGIARISNSRALEMGARAATPEMGARLLKSTSQRFCRGLGRNPGVK